MTVEAVVELATQAKAVLGTVGVMAVHGTVLALVALAITRGGRLRPAWQAAVWLVVLVKFVLPWSPALPWSLADLVAMLRGTPTGGAFALPPALAHHAAPAPALAPALGWVALAAAWLTGAAYMAARAIRAELGARAAVRDALPAPASAQAALIELATSLGVRAPRLVLAAPPPALAAAHAKATPGPHVIGIVRPTIVIPLALADEPQLLRAALAHELAHVRRRDGLARLIQLGALAAFWWFPVVRFASRRLELAREQACDAWALESADISRTAYARLLVRMAALPAVAAPALAAPRALDARVTAILGPAARARLGLVHRLALLAWIGLALGGARTATAHGKGEVCVYSPELAEALIETHPAADRDGDGTVSREEACDFQAELRKRMSETPPELVSDIDAMTTELLTEPLCCNCDVSLGRSSPPDPSTFEPRCFRDEGAY